MILHLIDGSSASRSLIQHTVESLARVGLTFSVFISCTHWMDVKKKKKKIQTAVFTLYEEIVKIWSEVHSGRIILVR